VSNKVLAISSHPDDIEIGCGATLAQAARDGADITLLVLSYHHQDFKGSDENIKLFELRNSTEKLGINKYVEIKDFPNRKFYEHYNEISELFFDISEEIDPDIVFLPASSDYHQDHRTVYETGVRAFKECTMLGYEVPWDHRIFHPEVFFTLEEKYIMQKCDAIECYKSVYMKHGSTLRELMVSLARVRGSQVRTEYAEAFECIKMVLR